MQFPALLLLNGVLSFRSPLMAAPEVDFAVPAECATEAEFFDTLQNEHQIERSELSFEHVSLTAAAGSFRLDWLDREGRRTFEDHDCRTLFRTAIVIAVSSVRETSPSGPALGAALSSDPSAATPSDPGAIGPASPEKVEPLKPEEPLLVPRASSSKNQPATAPRKTHRQARRAPLRGEISVAMGGAAALFPQPAFFAEGSGALLLGKGGVSLGIRYYPPATAGVTDPFGMRLEGWAGRLGALYEPLDWLRIDLGLAATYLMGTATGVRNPAEDAVWLFAPELDVTGQLVRSGPWALDLGVRGWIAVNAPRFEVDGEGAIYRLPPGGGAVFLRGKFSPK